jgi:hypothetical protein
MALSRDSVISYEMIIHYNLQKVKYFFVYFLFIFLVIFGCWVLGCFCLLGLAVGVVELVGFGREGEREWFE